MFTQHAPAQAHVSQQGVRQPQAWPSKASGSTTARAPPGTPPLSYIAPPSSGPSLSYVPPLECSPQVGQSQVSVGHQSRQAAAASPAAQALQSNRSLSRLHLQEGLERSIPPMPTTAVGHMPHTPVSDHREAFCHGPPRSWSQERPHQAPAAPHTDRMGSVSTSYTGPSHATHAETERTMTHSQSQRATNARSPAQRVRGADGRGAPTSSPKGVHGSSGPPSYTPPPAWSLPAPVETTPRKPSYVPPTLEGAVGPSRSPDLGARSQVSRRPSHGMKTRSPARQSHEVDSHSSHARSHTAFEGHHGLATPSARASPRQERDVGRQGSAPGCYTERVRSPPAGDGGRQHSSVMTTHGERQQKLEGGDRPSDRNLRAPRASHYERKIGELSAELQDQKTKRQDLEYQLTERENELVLLKEAKHHDTEALREAERKERHRASEKRTARERQDKLDQREQELEDFEAKLLQQKEENERRLEDTEAALQIRENELNVRESELKVQFEAQREAQQEEASQVIQREADLRQRERELAGQQTALMDSRSAALAEREAAQAKMEAMNKEREELQVQKQELQAMRFELEDRELTLNKEEDRLRNLRKQLEERERQHIEACKEAQVLRQHPTSARRLSPHGVGKENQNIRKQLEEQQDRMHEIKQMGWKQEMPAQGQEESVTC